MRKVFLQGSFSEGDFDALLASRQFIIADCYTIALTNGVTLRPGTGQQDVTVIPPNEMTAVTYSSRKLIASGVKFKMAIGLDKDEQTMTLAAQPGFIVPFSGSVNDGIPLMESLRRGDFDRATITLDRYYAPAWGAPFVGCVRLFSGRVGPLDTVGRLSATIKVQSDLYLLDQQMPKNLYQSNCNNTFCNSRCSLSKVTFAVGGVTTSGSTRSQLEWASASANWALGTVAVVNAAGVEYTRTIRDADSTFLYLSYPLDFDPVAGTEFTAYKGCAKTIAACDAYGNRTHNFSFPFMPVAETAY